MNKIEPLEVSLDICKDYYDFYEYFYIKLRDLPNISIMNTYIDLIIKKEFYACNQK